MILQSSALAALFAGLAVADALQPTLQAGNGRIFPNGTRNKYKWAYSSDSFWNQAIGSGAEYVDAGLNASKHVSVDSAWFIVVPEEDATPTPWFSPYSWTQRCGPSNTLEGWLPFPANLTIPDATKNPRSTPNNAAGVLLPDGKTLVNMNPIARCEPNGPVFGYSTPALLNQSIYEVGQFGGHGGSGLSSLGGLLRLGELLPGSGPISHTLQWELWAEKYYYNDGSGNESCCHQWPATRCDGYWKDGYGGKNPYIRQGSLLAIEPSIAPSINASLTTEPGRQILQALVDYGAYIVDDTAWDCQQFAVETGTPAEFEAAWGYEMTGTLPDTALASIEEAVARLKQAARAGDRDAARSSAERVAHISSGLSDTSPFVVDITTISLAMSAVSNSGPNTIGGGGTPRQGPCPVIGN